MPAIIAIIVIILVIIIYLLYIYALFYVSAFLFPLGCIALIGVVLFNYVRVVYEELLAGNGWIDSPTGTEPALKQYFFRKAFHDYWLVVEKSYQKNFEFLVLMMETGKKIFVNAGWFLTFPLGITYVLVAAAGTLAGFLAYVVFGSMHLAIVLASATLAIITAYSFRLFEYLLMVWRRISLKCPNAECHGDISLPYYHCPVCGSKHENLVPGSYGVIRRQCGCGAWLPTLFLFGRNQLPSFCPDCNKPLNSSIGVTRNIHIPIIGGPSAGKTNFLVASMLEIHQKAKTGNASVAFPEKKHEMLYAIGKRNFKSGSVAGKTAEESPDAFLVNVNTGGSDRLLYIYDPAGELFQRTDSMRRQEYYNYVDGFIFLIDPFSLAQVQSTLENELREKESQVKPCEESPQDVYSKLLQTIQQEKGIGKGALAKPLAVVVTKADAFSISNEIQLLIDKQAPSEPKTKQTRESRGVRAWLEKNGEGNLVRGMEEDFREVMYFYCSPLGRLPDASSIPFAPNRVLYPLGWLLKGYGLDFENGTASRAISASKTTTAAPYTPTITPQGETMNGKAIATLWGLGVVALFFVVVTFASAGFNGFQFLSSATTHSPSSNLVSNTSSNSYSIVSNKMIKSGVYGTVKYLNATFEARVIGGTIYTDKAELTVRQTSKTYTGQWVDWADVIRNSYIVDNWGTRYSSDVSLSRGWSNGNVGSGGSREGTVVFRGTLPAKVKQLTLHFSYVPGKNEIIVQIPVFEKKAGSK